VKKLGHDVITAAGGAAGIDAFQARHADFVIPDRKMDGTSGVDGLRAVSTIDPDVPIMIVTGFGTVETAVEAMKLGAFDFLTKPFTPEVVKLKVTRALELAGAREAEGPPGAGAGGGAPRPPQAGGGERLPAWRRVWPLHRADRPLRQDP